MMLRVKSQTKKVYLNDMNVQFHLYNVLQVLTFCFFLCHCPWRTGVWDGGEGRREVGVIIKGQHEGSFWCWNCWVVWLRWWIPKTTEGTKLFMLNTCTHTHTHTHTRVQVKLRNLNKMGVNCISGSILVVLEFCKILPWEKLGKVYEIFLYYFLQLPVNLQLSQLKFFVKIFNLFLLNFFVVKYT